MLSKEDLSDGTTFILELRDAGGLPVRWVTTLRGGIAAYWYAIYRKSDWAALRAHGAEVFHNRVSEAEAERIRRSGRCIIMQTQEVQAEEIDPPTQHTKPLQPVWENEGGSLAPVVLCAAAVGAKDPAAQNSEATEVTK